MFHIFINTLIFGLVLVFIVILKQQFFNKHYKIENFKNNNTNSDTKNDTDNSPEQNNKFILAQQNAGNINVLKNRVNDLEVLKNKVINNSNKIKLLEANLEEILQEQINFTSQNTIDNIKELK